MGKIYVGHSDRSGFVSSTTKTGLGKLIGVSSDSVRRGLSLKGGYGFVTVGGKWGELWTIGEVELVKVGGDRGKVKGGSGFLGMKGKDGLKKGI